MSSNCPLFTVHLKFMNLGLLTLSSSSITIFPTIIVCNLIPSSEGSLKNVLAIHSSGFIVGSTLLSSNLDFEIPLSHKSPNFLCCLIWKLYTNIFIEYLFPELLNYNSYYIRFCDIQYLQNGFPIWPVYCHVVECSQDVL